MKHRQYHMTCSLCHMTCRHLHTHVCLCIVLQVQAQKPSYEIGTSSQLSFASRLQPQSRGIEHEREKREVWQGLCWCHCLLCVTVVEQPRVSSETAKIWSLSTADTVDDDLVSE